MKPLRTALALIALAAALPAQEIQFAQLPCLPTGENTPLVVRIDPQPAAEIQVRLYFRRLNVEVEDFYFVAMVPIGGGNFWSTFPQPEASKFERHELENAADDRYRWAEWWRAKETSESRDPNSDLDQELIRERAALGRLEKRDWLSALENEALERWLEEQKTEPAEYFVALFDPNSRRFLTRSPMQLAAVRDDCSAALSPQQVGLAANMTVGETSRWQAGQPIFHWECTGIVTRLDPLDVLRADESCRACVVGWWPLAAIPGALGIVTIFDDDPNPPAEISPSRPQ